MAILKVVNKHYDSLQDVANLIQYVLNPNKVSSGNWGVRNVYLYEDSTMTANLLMQTNQYYGKTQGSMLHHFILSYSRYEYYMKNEMIMENACHIIDGFLKGYQCIFAMHENTDNPHVHIIFNSVNMMNGMKFPLKKDYYYAITRFLEDVTFCKDYKGKIVFVEHKVVFSE